MIGKVRNYDPIVLRAHASLCAMHKGRPGEGRFSRPPEVSEDIPLFELKVDPSNKLRVHGFFVQATFFLIWLDREHACFPE